MMHTTQTLYDTLMDTLAQVNAQIGATFADGERTIAAMPRSDSVSVYTVYKLKQPDGKGLLTDLLVAKAQIVSAMANLKSADLASRTPRR